MARWSTRRLFHNSDKGNFFEFINKVFVLNRSPVSKLNTYGRDVLIKKFALAVLRLYKHFVSPLFPPSCRFQPTCSVYTYRAIEQYGVLKGGWLGFKRILRCNPFNSGGYDPVP